MEPCGLFHSKLWFFYHNSSLVFKSLCQIESFASYCTMEFSFRATYQYEFVWIFDQYGFQYGYEFKSCYSDVKLNLLSHISQCNFVCCFIQSYLPLKFCPFKSRCPIETFPAYLKMKSCLLFHLKLWIFEKNSSFVFKSRCQIGFFSLISQWNFVCSSLQSYFSEWISDMNSSLVLFKLVVQLNLL